MDRLRSIVSRNRKRFERDGLDLDLAYILPNLIAMGFPARKLDKVYRNDFDDLMVFINKYIVKQGQSFVIFNLCPLDERDIYGGTTLEPMVNKRFTTRDHHPPKFIDIVEFCESACKSLQDERTTVFVHCKAGKGRTGVMISSLLLCCQRFDSPIEAMKFYGESRTHDCKGVTIPSQRRYVEYYGCYLQRPLPDKYKPTNIEFLGLLLNYLPCCKCRKHERMSTVRVKLKDSRFAGISSELSAPMICPSRVTARDVHNCFHPLHSLHTLTTCDGNAESSSDSSTALHLVYVQQAFVSSNERGVVLTEDVLFEVERHGDRKVELISSKQRTNLWETFHFWLNTRFLIPTSEGLYPLSACREGCAGILLDKASSFPLMDNPLVLPHIKELDKKETCVLVLNQECLDGVPKGKCKCQLQVVVAFMSGPSRNSKEISDAFENP